MSVDNLLSRLQRVRRTGPHKWIASCPTREDKGPSLAIRETDDGTLLLHDFGGDDVEAILAAVGLSFADLYPETRARLQSPSEVRSTRLTCWRWLLSRPPWPLSLFRT